jgi:hydrogenase assembly chaperone HypC/HupF
MCLSFPGRVIALDADGATIETDGRTRRALTLAAPETRIGDWVLVSAGSIMQRLEPEAARAMREALLEAARLVAEDAQS